LAERKVFSDPLFRRAEGVLLAYTRFEKARMLGARALQISLGAPIVAANSLGTADAIVLAWREFDSAVLPIRVQRGPDALD